MLMDTIDAYIALRRAAGFRLTGIAPTLTRFGDYARQCGEDIVRADTAIAWASRGRSPERRETVLRVVAAFARHARAEDPRHEVPPTGVFGGYYRRPTPFIFSADQVRQLLEEARRLGPPASLRPYTYATLFALLAATGLRVSEALALRIDDLKVEGLHIRETKFQKTRLVPVHPTVETALERYLERRRAVGGDTGLFFIGSDGRPLRYGIVHWTFVKLVRAIGLGKPGQPRPRLHCLRHTFAVRALEKCPEGLPSITRHQVALMTYLGHSHVQHTYWYMQSTPHLLRGIANACEACDGGGGR
jgi:integrase